MNVGLMSHVKHEKNKNNTMLVICHRDVGLSGLRRHQAYCNISRRSTCFRLHDPTFPIGSFFASTDTWQLVFSRPCLQTPLAKCKLKFFR